jgi:hypothetical protein
MARSRSTLSVGDAVWVQFQGGKIRAEIAKPGVRMSVVRYLEPVNFSTYKARKGERRRVSNLFLFPR